MQPKGAVECPFCGYVPEHRLKATVTSNASGTLEEYKCADESDPALLLLYSELMSYATYRGYKPGWAYHSLRPRPMSSPRMSGAIPGI